MTGRRNDDPTDAEIDRSQARMEHAFGAGFADEPTDSGRLGNGLHFDVPSATYFSDPCHRPSLTQSIAKVLIERSPAHAWVQHARLNPNWKPDDPTKYDVGNIAHRLLLGRGKDIVIVEGYDDWRTKDAKAVRDDAQANGRLAVLEKHHRMGEAVANAARSQLNALGWPMVDGKAEVVVIATEGGLPLRTMIDWMANPTLLVDLKTTGLSVAPSAIPNMMVSAGWPIQAAFQERVLDHLDPEGRGRRKFRFIAIEDEPPYALTPVELTEAVMTLGRKMVDHAINVWRTCMATDEWPAYGGEICRPEFPGWKETQWLDREVVEDDRARRRRAPLTSIMGG